MEASATESSTESIPTFEFDRYFVSWLEEMKTSLTISFYRQGQVIALGCDHHPAVGLRPSLYLTRFARPMGLAYHSNHKTLIVGSSGRLWCYTNAAQPLFQHPDSAYGLFDGHYVPRQIYSGTDTDIHDIVMSDDGQIYYVSAAFSCIAMPSATHSFALYWQPPWISKITPEDRCHLNGLCCRGGRPRYVTAVSRDDIKGGWREHRVGHGVVYDLLEERVVCQGLTMPHSPRWFNGRLWLLESGTGSVGYVDLVTGEFHRIAFIPGFLRGMCFIQARYMVVASSEDRHEKLFEDLPLGQRLKELDINARCGIHVIDLATRDILYSFVFKEPYSEIYDVCAIPEVIRPMIEDFENIRNLRDYCIDNSRRLM